MAPVVVVEEGVYFLVGTNFLRVVDVLVGAGVVVVLGFLLDVVYFAVDDAKNVCVGRGALVVDVVVVEVVLVLVLVLVLEVDVEVDVDVDVDVDVVDGFRVVDVVLVLVLVVPYSPGAVGATGISFVVGMVK